MIVNFTGIPGAFFAAATKDPAATASGNLPDHAANIAMILAAWTGSPDRTERYKSAISDYCLLTGFVPAATI
jgi:hypothetical protein